MTISVNASDWNGLSSEDRGKIQDIIAQNFEGQTVDGGSSGQPLSGNPTCEAACNVAQAAAITACNALPFPASLVCVAAANEAGNFCRSRC